MSKNQQKILIFEDAEIIRAGFRSILSSYSRASFIIEECNSHRDFGNICLKFKPEILLINPNLFFQNNQLIQSHRENNKFFVIGIVYSYFNNETLNNFDDIIRIDAKKDQIINLFEKLKSNSEDNQSTPTIDTLSRREKEVLKLIASGFASQKIAETLFISHHTVNTHRKNIMKKLDIKTVSGLTIYAVLNNIISLKEV